MNSRIILKLCIYGALKWRIENRQRFSSQIPKNQQGDPKQKIQNSLILDKQNNLI